MKNLIIVLLISLCTSVFADSVHICQGNSCNDTSDQASGTSNSVSGSVTNTATSNSGSLSTTATGNSGSLSNSISVSGARQAPSPPDVIANPTAPCRIAVGIGGSGVGFGIGIGSSVLDDGCDAREDARLLHNMGLHKEAVLRLCLKPELSNVLPLCH